MKFAFLGYGLEQNWAAMSKSELDAMLEVSFTYDSKLLREGHLIGDGTALQPSRTAKTLRWQNGAVIVTDGPFAETKEQLGGIGLLQARDMDHAIELMSRHPGLRYGATFELRPIDEESLKLGNVFEKSLVLFLRAEIHHVLDAGAIVPTAVENDDLAPSREVLHIALHVHLRLLPVRRGGKGHEAKHARANAFADGLDRAAFTGGVAALEDNDDPQLFVFNPLLQFAQLPLELAQLFHVPFVAEFLVVIGFVVFAHKV